MIELHNRILLGEKCRTLVSKLHTRVTLMNFQNRMGVLLDLSANKFAVIKISYSSAWLQICHQACYYEGILKRFEVGNTFYTVKDLWC